MSCRFRMLGGASLEAPDGPVTGRAAQRRRLAVLSLLSVTSGGTVSRDRIVGCLWPEAEQSKARHLLSGAIYALRQALGEGAIVSCGDEELRLDGKLVWTDVAAFEKALDSGHLERAAELYGGAFLDGFHVSDAPGFERWQERQRRRLGSLYGEALERLARAAKDEDDAEAAVRWWKRRAAHDPYDSRVAYALMSAFAAAGNPAAAIRHARVHELMLRDELGLEPSPEVSALAERLRGGATRKETDPKGGAAAPVPGPEDDGGEAVPEPTAPTTNHSGSAAGSSRSDSAPDPGRFPKARRRTLAGVAAVLALTLVGSLFLDTGSTATDARPARYVLADFEDHATGSDLGAAVTEALRIDLAQSRAVSLAAPAFVRSVLERMRRDSVNRLGTGAAREVAVREGLGGVVTGDVHSVGTGYLLTAEVIDPVDGGSLAAARATAEADGEIVASIDSLAKDLRRAIGEPTKSLRAAAPLERVTTSSLEALERYSVAVRLSHRGARFETIRDLLREAIAHDTTFALAYRKLSSHLGNGSRDPAGSVEAARKAYENRQDLPERERLLVEGWYQWHVAEDLREAVAVYERLEAAHPDAYVRMVALHLANLYAELGELESAASAYRRVIEVDSLSSRIPYWNLSLVQLQRGAFEAAERTIDAYERLFFDRLGSGMPDPWSRRAGIAAGRRNFERALEIRKWMRERTRDPFQSYYNDRLAVYLAAAAGHIGEAEDATRRALRYATENDRPFHALTTSLAMASIEIRTLHDSAAGLERIRAALAEYPLHEMDPAVRPTFWVANLLASAGRSAEARRLLDRELKDTESGVEMQARDDEWRMSRAWIALAERAPAEALEQISPLLQRMNEGMGCWDYRNVCPLVATARAYEMAGQSDSAIAVYERFLRAPFTLSWLDAWFRADALERLAALHEERGESLKAGEAYELLLRFWRDADPELRPRLEQARARALALRGDSEQMGESAARP